MKTAVVLLNFGTPARPSRLAVAAYLRQMLTDPRVLDLPWPLRALLGGVVIPLLRAGRAAAAYRAIWRQDGSPLLLQTQQLADALHSRLQQRSPPAGAAAKRADEYRVWAAMRLGKPSVRQALHQVQAWRPHRLVLLPLYPQYADSTTGTVLEQVFSHLARWPLVPQLIVSGEYADAPGFIAAFAAVVHTKANRAKMAACDAVLFSFHGLPVRHLRKSCATGGEDNCPCQSKSSTPQYPAAGGRDPYCYRAACWATARALAAELGLADDKWHLGFQSRLGGAWLLPYTDQLMEQLVAEGAKKLVVFCPSFTTDCLETLEEVGIELTGRFRALGGEELTLMPCPNASPAWVEFLASLVAESQS